jgi:DNA-directed RNA polymerase subunit F
MSDLKETILERHQVGRFGSVLDFVNQSKNHGEWTFSDDKLVDYLKRAASCDDEKGRKLAIDLIGSIEWLVNDGDELRKRFVTTSEALGKVNKALKEELENKQG